MSVDPLIVDTYAGDLDGHTDIAKLVAAGPPWHGWMGKATQGNYYQDAAWFQPHWRDARELAGARYGVDWFRGAYHYVDFRVDAKAQADFYLHVIDAAGGWGDGDLWPVVDVERAGQRGDPPAQAVIDCVSRVAAVIKAATGRGVIMYGGSFLRDLGITSHMGCDLAWVARYSRTLPVGAYASIGWTLEDLFAWQYAGDGVGALEGYPLVSPIGKVDVSVLTVKSGQGALGFVRNAMCGRPSVVSG